MYKRNFLLCTIAGSLIFSHLSSAYANTPPREIPKVYVKEGEEAFNNVIIRDRYYPVIAGGSQSVATITEAIITSEIVGLSATRGGRINATEIDTKTLIKGLEITNGIINLEDSIVHVKGNHESYGIVFGKVFDFHVNEGEEVVNKAFLTNTKLLVRDGIGILGPYSNAEIRLKNSEILSDILLKNSDETEIDPVTLTLTADHSILEGRAKTLQKNTTVFTLSNNSKWYLKISQNEADNSNSLFNYVLLDINKRAHSSVSVLNLNDSAIVFNAPTVLTEGHYQTLSVGREQTAEYSDPQSNRDLNEKTVYTATGDARIYFNTAWSNGLPKDQQKTDRLLVHGDVSGSTTIHFSNLSKSEPSNIENTIPLNMRGLSLVQVSGKANENAFKLANGYATIGGLPYKYTLNAYGPTSSHGKASLEQSLVGEKQNFWDFRLQSATLDREAKIKALVPQVASYLVMPNALFSAGFTDVNNQNALLNDMQTALFAPESHKKSGIFLSSYGNKITLSSNRNPLQYGYGADVQHTALQAGIALAGLEKQNITTSLGLLGTYGKLAFTPKDIEGAEKSTIDKWSFTVYGNIQHNNGIYLDTLFSYGTLKGNITTAFIGNTTQLNKTKTLSASATVSQKLGTGVEGLVFEPQAQFVYQRLMFEKLSDIDGFEVNMGKPHQWLLRFGGCLIQTVMPVERNHAVSFYGKVNFIKAFSDNGTIKIGDTFHRDSMGSSLEGGFGVNAQLSQNIALHAGVNYQHKLQKAGISAINFSGGIHYGF
ncbi:outer membrane autotransporter barrel domain-containing protein [Bartonella quintana JK 19]|uniref:autotransporter family protein n=1 Tax=Bartonella quintana TaxID=803 RepID=UPI00049FEC86|nr:autotransporter outer membrane beta-barrel domain-containing protein [Bartonella quintana]KEC57613.1 outer membrane autotransporter barrel domain-containing protein [Bartonella quintana JK 19]